MLFNYSLEDKTTSVDRVVGKGFAFELRAHFSVASSGELPSTVIFKIFFDKLWKYGCQLGR